MTDYVDIMTDENRYCGAHNYYYDNRTVHFIINAERNCQV